jgi:hypothetical protein
MATRMTKMTDNLPRSPGTVPLLETSLPPLVPVALLGPCCHTAKQTRISRSHTEALAPRLLTPAVQGLDTEVHRPLPRGQGKTENCFPLKLLSPKSGFYVEGAEVQPGSPA